MILYVHFLFKGKVTVELNDWFKKSQCTGTSFDGKQHDISGHLTIDQMQNHIKTAIKTRQFEGIRIDSIKIDLL